MRNWFPTMTSCPDTEKIVGTFAYWLLSIVLIPLLLPFLLQGFYDDVAVLVWLEIGYHVLNCAAMIVVHWNYLFFAWLDFRLKWRECLSVIGIGVVLILGVAYPLMMSMNYLSAVALPVVEVELLTFAPWVLDELPLAGTLCMTLATPIATCCMIYAVCFAPGCSGRKPWVGYLALALLVALPRVLCTSLAIDALTLWPLYFAQLPIHLICCWAFQKTDTVLVPACILAVVNLVGCMMF